jgi:hypothetical protein
MSDSFPQQGQRFASFAHTALKPGWECKTPTAVATEAPIPADQRTECFTLNWNCPTRLL